MPLEVLQRDLWTGKPRQLGDLLRLRKGTKVATCQLWTHQLGWECRLFAGEDESDFIASQVCRSQDEVFTFGEKWTAALKAKGWS